MTTLQPMPALRRFIRRVSFLARAEVLHLARDKATVVQVLVLPIVQLLLLSNVATFAVRATPTYVVDHDRSAASRALVTRLAASELFRVAGASASRDAAESALLAGRVTAVVSIPAGFEAALARGTEPATLGVDVDAAKGSAAGIVQSYVAQIVAPPAAGGGGGERIEVRTRGWYNPELDYRDHMVPGILVALVTMIGTLLAAQSVAREKEVGTLEQLNATPLTRAELIAAKLLPLWALALIDLALGLLVARFAFDVPVRGSVALLFAAASIYLVVALSIGLWISAFVDTQQQAMFVTFFVLMVYLLMSGLFTPIDSMPGWVQWLSVLNPVRHFVEIARAILVKGAGFGAVLAPLGVLTAYAALTLTLAVRRHAKTAG